MIRNSKVLFLLGFVASVSCSQGEFISSQRKSRACSGDEPGCKKDILLGEPTGPLKDSVGTDTSTSTSTSTSNSTTDSGEKVKVGVEFSGTTSSTSPSTSTTDGVCTIAATNVGVSDKLMGPNWRCKTESMTIPDAIVLPSDAYDINVKITQYAVDDWNPCTKINGQEIGCNRGEKTQCTGGGPGPRLSKYDFDLSKHLKAGANELYVESFNKHTYWSMWFTVEGTYKTKQEGCTHTLKLIKN